MQICHELPLCMLKKNEEVNDYDFVLFYPYITDEKYREWAKYQRRRYRNRKMIFDNSAYEFFEKGATSFDHKAYIDAINDLCPDIYIIPDKLMDAEATMKSFNDWIPLRNRCGLMYKDGELSNSLNLYKEIDCGAQPMAVPQAYDSYYELKKSLCDMIDSIHCNSDFKDIDINIAIPFHNKLFKYTATTTITQESYKTYGFDGVEKSEDVIYAIGRCMVMDKLMHSVESYVYNTYGDTKHGGGMFVWERLKFHLLGTHHPLEFKYLSKYDKIVSFDTAYPVKLALEGTEIFTEKGKPKVIFDDFMNENIQIDTQEMILSNCKKLRDIL